MENYSKYDGLIKYAHLAQYLLILEAEVVSKELSQLQGTLVFYRAKGAAHFIFNLVALS